jgi:tetratricopeptide (TPR) repeat protein
MPHEQKQPAMMPMPEPIRPGRALPVWAMVAGVAVLAGWIGWMVFSPTARALLQAPSEREQIAKGQYKEAIDRLESVVSRTPFQPEQAALLLEARLEIGDYRRALEQGEEWLRRGANPGIAERTAEAAYSLGEYDRALRLIEPFSTLRADWLKGTLAATRGQKTEARVAFERVVRQAMLRVSLLPEEKGIVAAAQVEVGRFKEANDTYRDATTSAPENSRLKSEWGWLMLEKHNPGDAGGLFEEALEANPNETRALLGMAMMAADRWDSGASEALQKALAINPNLAEAHLLLGRIAIEEDNYKAAEEKVEAALKVNPNLAEAWSLKAVTEYLQQRPAAEQEIIPRILRQNPAYGRVFADLGDFLVNKRQYGKAVEFYRRAIETDPDLPDARANLGINLLRLGEEAEGRRTLEEAYGLDPYNVWTVNTLRLLDSFTRFDMFETARFRGKLHQKESAVLRPYVEELLETAFADQMARYKFTPDRKIVFEMYPDHEDFAVRTLGLPGLGALGASFGSVVAMDSPSARPVGAFHWASTLWHELAHVVTLGLTDNRVPRWFTEGLSTYEETKARPGWGDPMGPEIIRPLKQRGLIPMEKLNGVFVRPEYPAQIGFAYFQSGMICEFIVEKYGFPKILEMLAAYRNAASDEAAIRRATGLSLSEFDAQFREYARERTYNFAEAVVLRQAERGEAEHGPEPPEGQPEIRIEGQAPGQTEERSETSPNPNDYFAHLRQAAQFEKERKFGPAIGEAATAKRLFPLYTDEGDPYRLLARIYEGQGQKQLAAAELLEWKVQKGRDPETFKKLAALLQDLGRTPEAIRTLEDALYISMFDLDIHQKLGEWYLGSENPRSAAREYQAVLALDPPDKAEAHYRLAMAYQALSDRASARRQVLAALEIAPGFRAAQRLLLELSGN